MLHDQVLYHKKCHYLVHKLQESVHKTDILTVAFGAPHLMATASFCGKVTSTSSTAHACI